MKKKKKWKMIIIESNFHVCFSAIIFMLLRTMFISMNIKPIKDHIFFSLVAQAKEKKSVIHFNYRSMWSIGRRMKAKQDKWKIKLFKIHFTCRVQCNCNKWIGTAFFSFFHLNKRENEWTAKKIVDKTTTKKNWMKTMSCYCCCRWISTMKSTDLWIKISKVQFHIANSLRETKQVVARLFFLRWNTQLKIAYKNAIEIWVFLFRMMQSGLVKNLSLAN